VILQMLQAASPQVSALHTHHRTKSSPDPLNTQNMSLAEGKSFVLLYCDWVIKYLRSV
jgi:hypothetical protein